MTQAQFLADGLVSVAAIAGLLILALVVWRAGSVDAMARRFLFGLGILTILMGARVLHWTTGNGLFEPVVVAAAGFVPLCAVVIAEGLLRRHAPPPVKHVVLLGTLAFVMLAPVPAFLVEPLRAYLLLVFQFFGLASAGWMAVTRDRQSLSPPENRLVDRIALSLLLILPFFATDFRALDFGLPVRMGGIAILFLCWLAIGLRRSALDHRDTIRSFAVLFGTAMVAGIGIGWIAGFGLSGMVQSVAIVLSAALVSAIALEAMNLRGAQSSDTLLHHIANSTETNAAAFLRSLREHVLVDGALMLGPDELSEFDPATLLAIFAQDPVRQIAEVRRKPGAPNTLEQLVALFERYEVTHLMLVSRTPLTLVALNMPSLGSAPGADTELRAVQRVAMLMSEKRDD